MPVFSERDIAAEKVESPSLPTDIERELAGSWFYSLHIGTAVVC